MKRYRTLLTTLILVALLYNGLCAQELYSWSRTGITIYETSDLDSPIIGEIEVGARVENLSHEGNKSYVQSWIINSEQGSDTLEFSGKFIKVKFGEHIGYCLNTFLTTIKYDRKLLENDSVYLAFDYYKKIMDLSQIRKEENVTGTGEDELRAGRILFADNSILTYEYGAYGGGYAVQLEDKKIKDFLLICLHLMEINKLEFHLEKRTEKDTKIHIDACEDRYFYEKNDGIIELSYSFGC